MALPTCGLLHVLLELDKVCGLQDDRVGPELGGRQARGNGAAQEVHWGVVVQVEQLVWERVPCGESTVLSAAGCCQASGLEAQQGGHHAWQGRQGRQVGLGAQRRTLPGPATPTPLPTQRTHGECWAGSPSQYGLLTASHVLSQVSDPLEGRGSGCRALSLPTM